MTKSQSLRRRIAIIKGKGKEEVVKHRRNINDDNLTSLERSILGFLVKKGEPASVREIAEEMYGREVEPEAKGKESVRTIRNALRIPKSMGLILPKGSGMYAASDEFTKIGLDAAKQKAEELRRIRYSHKKDLSDM